MNMATEESTIRFLQHQLVWYPTVIGRDGKSMGTLEFWVSPSPEETDKTINALLNSIERQGADTLLTLREEVSKLRQELSKLRKEAISLSDSLRQSRSTKEAIENGERLQSIMQLLRVVESYYLFLSKRTGTSGD